MTETMLQTVLEEDELHYVLETLSARAVWGMDNERLFPATTGEREQRLARGLALLKEHGWLLPAAHDTWHMDAGLIRLIAAVADPEIVLTTTYFLSTTAKAVIAYYLAQPLIVELTQLENTTYRLASLPSLPFLLDRIGQSLALPVTATATNGQPRLVDRAVFRQVTAHHHRASGNGSAPVENNTTPNQFLTNAHLLAELEVGRTNGDKLLKQTTLTLFKVDHEIWVAQYTDENQQTIRLESVTRTSFAATLVTIIQSLRQINPEAI
jgi:hypothetical protein